VAPNEVGDCRIVVANWPSYDYATMIVTNLDNATTETDTLSYSYSATESGSRAVTRVVRAGPNPFFDTTTWVLRIADASSDVRLSVYDALGRRVRQLVNRQLARGDHPITWDRTTDASRRAVSGVYYYELRVDRQVQSGRLVVLN
jgi:flagellar hook assembly protein FlgD